MKLLHLSNIAGKLGGGVSEVVHSLMQHQGEYDCKPICVLLEVKRRNTKSMKI